MLDKKLIEIPDAFITTLIFEETGDRVNSLRPIEGRGIMNRVFKVEASERTLVLRMNLADSPFQRYAGEAWFLEQARQAGVPVPVVCGQGVKDGIAYMVQEFIDGPSGDDPTINRLAVWHRLGIYAAKINTIPCEGYGDDDETSPGIYARSWHETAGRMLEEAFRDH